MEVLASADTGLMPYGRGAKQHIICALDEDRALPDVTSSCLSIVTRMAELFPTEDVVGTLPASPSWTAGISWPLVSAGLMPPSLSTGGSAGCIVSAFTVSAFGVHMSRPKQPIFAVMSWTPSPMVSSNDRVPSWPLTLCRLSVESNEDLSGVEII